MPNIVYSRAPRKPSRSPRAAPPRKTSAAGSQPEQIGAGLTLTPLGEVAATVVARLAQRCQITPDHARVVISLLHPEAR